MAATTSELKLNLKIIVDIKAKKVIFAEAGKDFVDFIFTLLTLPLSTVTKLLNEKGMVGCLGSLYKSIECLESQFFEPETDKYSVLKPRSSVALPLLSLRDSPTTLKIYKCCTSSNFIDCCSHCGRTGLTSSIYGILPPHTKYTPKYVKDTVPYMVMDNLEVKPMSFTEIKSHVKDFDVLEEKDVQVGPEEGLAILKASLETNTVLTSVFLGKKTM